MPKRGTGVYHRKDGSWEARYVKGIDSNGKKIYGSVYARTCHEAKEKRQEKEDQIRLFQREICSRKITVCNLAEEWLYVNAGRLRQTTKQKYEGFLRNHIAPTIGNRPVLYLTHINLYDFSIDRLNGGLSPQSVNAILTFLHTCFKYGQRQYKLPIPEVSYLPASRQRRRALSDDELQRLLAFLLEDMDISRLGVLLTLYTGLRIGEVCGLKWGDISNGCISVTRTLQRVMTSSGHGTEIISGPPKTETSTRVIPVPDFLWPMIEPFRRGEDDYFLSTPLLPVVEPRVMHYRIKKYLREIDVCDASFHTLRHTFATQAAMHNIELRALSEILGHSSTKITADVYVHPSIAYKRQCVNVLPVPEGLINAV